MFQISFIVCSHGFGHFKRVTGVVKELLKLTTTTKIVVHCKTWQLNQTQDWPDTRVLVGNENVQFHTALMEHAPDWSSSGSIDEYNAWSALLGSDAYLQNSDLIVSDNYVAPLVHFPSTILMGSFLWNDILHSNPMYQAVADREAQLLKKIRPRMIGVKDMMMPAVINATMPIPMPWFCETYEQHVDHKLSGKILITGGGTNANEEILLELINRFVGLSHIKIEVDSKLYAKIDSENGNVNVSRFSFQPEAFASLDLIICRPGIGILTDAVKYHIPVVSMGEATNKEMNYNAERVEQLGIGKSISASSVDRIVKDIEQLYTFETLAGFRANLKKLETGGAEKTAHYILSLL